METHRVSTAGAELHVRVLGPGDGTPVIMLHGWPDTGECWLAVAERLSDRFRLILPDNRGFGASSMPDGTDAYRTSVILGDVLALADWAGWDRFSLVGHDFGGPVAWAAGMFAADRIERIAVVSAPHPMMWKTVGARSLSQWQRSFYAWLLNAGDAGLRLLSSADFAVLARLAFGDLFPEDEVERRRAAWREPGRFEAMARWYRAGYNPDLLNPDLPLDLPPVRVPTLYIQGREDWAFVPAMAEGSGAYVEAEFDEWLIDGAGHWLPYTHAEGLADRFGSWFG